MTTERRLHADEISSAADIQLAVDRLAAAGGGRLVLPAMELTLDRSIELRSSIELVGQGEATRLRKGPGRRYALTGYHNYGMRDVPVDSTAGLVPGMTVSVLDDLRRGFYSTFARIVWVEDGWVGLDRGLQADLLADAHPVLTTAHPLICGHQVHDVAVRDLYLDGNRAENEAPMDACRGAALYFYQSHDCEVSDVVERDFRGEGLGYQMCHDIRVRRCRFEHNTGNGFHPGAGSTNTLFEECTATGNQGCGFFFCVRANHITVRGCTFADNQLGMSIGTRDCYNLIVGCTFRANHGPGLVARACPRPVEVHSIEVRDCQFERNGEVPGDLAPAQVHLEADAHDLIFRACAFAGKRGMLIEPGVTGVWLEGNALGESRLETAASSLAAVPPAMVVGYGTATDADRRHLAAGHCP